MNDNGGKEEQEKVRHCPFMDKYCIGKRCALYVEMRKMTGGLLQAFGMCSFNALVQMTSEMNSKTQPPQQQKVQIPRLLRG